MKIALNFFIGTAAELIKVYPVIRLARERGYIVRVIASGQSRENFLMQYRDFELPSDILVWLVEGSEDLQRARSALWWFLRALVGLRFSSLLARGLERTYVVVHGDTLSTLAGAWLGWRSRLPVVHIEAGLRSPQLLNPFPEEITRRLVSRFASWHMAPDAAAAANLQRAGVGGTVVNTDGNTLMDAVLLSRASAPSGDFALANIHRFENLNSDARWAVIVDTVVRAASERRVIFVTHPQTRHKLDQDPATLERFRTANIEIRDRMPFSEFIGLLKASQFLLSDGGSNQEECSYLGKPCLLLRESSERVEGLDSCCVLSKMDSAVIQNFLAAPTRFLSTTAQSARTPSSTVLDSLIKATYFATAP